MTGPEAPRRAVLLTGGRHSERVRLPAGALVLDAGAARTPLGVGAIGARDLLPAEELEGLQRACLAFATHWHAALPQPEGCLLSPGRACESALLLHLGQALKHLVLLRRLAAGHGALRVEADPRLPALRWIGPVLAADPVPVHLEAARPWGHRLIDAASRARSALRTPPRKPLRDARSSGLAPAATSGGRRVWGLANYRNRPLLEALARDPRFSFRIFERSAENRYLPVREGPDPADREGLPLWAHAHRNPLEARAREYFPGVPGAGRVATSILDELMQGLAPDAEGEARAWTSLLSEDRPAAIVSGIPWAGDLRTLALVAASQDIPLVACQDGALSERGAGGVPVSGAALAWGPLGAAWFARRGVDASRIVPVGDPYLDDVVGEVARGAAPGLRARLGIPTGHRVLLASAQNSAPHFLPADPADPVRLVRMLLDAVAGVPGWCLVLKPHPRVPLVDGERRMRLLRRLAAEVPAARLTRPTEPIAALMALADAHVGDGDTLSLEMLACGRPAVLFERADLPGFYPEMASSGAMPVVRSPSELAALLRQGVPPPPTEPRLRLLGQHLWAEAAPADALAGLIGDTDVRRRGAHATR